MQWPGPLVRVAFEGLQDQLVGARPRPLDLCLRNGAITNPVYIQRCTLSRLIVAGEYGNRAVSCRFAVCHSGVGACTAVRGFPVVTCEARLPSFTS